MDTGLRGMVVWKKRVPEAEQAFWEERLQCREDASLVITETPGKKSVRLEVYCRTEKAAETLKSDFGGRIVPLKNTDWVVAESRRPMRPPVRIRGRLVLTEEVTAAGLRRVRSKFPGRTVLSIPAEMAFGTGHHATTATCLRMLVDLSDTLTPRDVADARPRRRAPASWQSARALWAPRQLWATTSIPSRWTSRERTPRQTRWRGLDFPGRTS